MEERPLLSKYSKGLKRSFNEAKRTNPTAKKIVKEADANAVKLTREKFLAYVDVKRVRYKQPESQQTLQMFLADGNGFID